MVRGLFWCEKADRVKREFFYGRVKAIWRYTYVWTSMPVTYFEVTFHLLSLICPVTVSKVSRVTKILGQNTVTTGITK